eukprot:901542-Pyramimonas_sp.AAC.1
MALVKVVAASSMLTDVKHMRELASTMMSMLTSPPTPVSADYIKANIPSTTTSKRSELFFDISLLLWRRYFLKEQGPCTRWASCDSSPQADYNWFWASCTE